MAELAVRAAVFVAQAAGQSATVGTANPDSQDFSVRLHYPTLAASEHPNSLYLYLGWEGPILHFLQGSFEFNLNSGI